MCQPFPSTPSSPSARGETQGGWVPWHCSPGIVHLCWALSLQYLEALGICCSDEPRAWDSAGQTARGSVREPTRNTEGLETHLASGGCAGNLPAFCQSIVKIIPFPVFSLCQISIFREEKRKKKPKNSFGKFAASIQPDSSMPLAIASLQQEVLKPALHFRKGCSEAEEGEADQRHFVPQSDPKTKRYRG